ncbi:aldo/keto reductase [Terrisporobacter mayombei]|uniref:Glyoxal reductase n=1 Tax=Terrisporobacter mayombei TaxID=1541 RepID=A0ABY9Q2J8_9FIRM|nr:aldo/keto reductase [Terrisporobacter mayombei]MCC3869298.1 aldo/keto reductase [Terrisporobacter mayombei]WMT82127.1 Glyoxal reductase [Terrisporobacter mayombei]
MERRIRQLSNGVEIPIVGFGTYKLQNENNEACNIIKESIDLGYRNIDTASFYNNEEGIGKGIRESGIHREELFVTTKVWIDDDGYENTINAFNKSLDKLGLEYIDLYLVHWPTENIKETWRAMEYLYKEKKVRAIGVCNFTVKQIEEIIGFSEINPMVNQIEIHPKRSEKELLKVCKRHNIVVQAWSPIMRGQLSSNTIIKKLSQKYNKSEAQIILRWHLQNNVIAIPKTSKLNRIKENINIFDFEIEKEDIDEIDSINKNERMKPQKYENLYKVV